MSDGIGRRGFLGLAAAIVAAPSAAVAQPAGPDEAPTLDVTRDLVKDLPAPATRIRTICCRCHAVLVDAPAGPRGEVSHGICQKDADLMRAEIAAWKAGRRAQASAGSAA